MADKISVEIGLEGGETVERQLEQIGQAGQKAFGDIQSAAEQVNLESTTDEFSNLGNAGVAAFEKIQQAAQSATVFEGVLQGVKKVEGAFESLGTAVTRLGARLTRSLGPLGVFARAFGPAGIAAGVAAGAFTKFGDDAADAVNKLTVQGAKLGLTAQQFDALQQALTRTGISSDAVFPGLQKLRESFAEGIVPANIGAEFQRFIAQLEKMPDSVQRTQLAMQQLGDVLGAQVIAGLQTGALNSQNFAAALGAVTPATQEQIIQAAKYQQALNQLSTAWAALKAEFTPITIPIFQFVTTEINNLRNDLRRLGQELQLLKAIWDLFTAPADKQAAAAQRVKELWDQLGQTAQQAGQRAAQGTMLVVDPLTGLPTLIGEANQALNQTGQAGLQAGQQIASGMQSATQATNQTTQAVSALQGWLTRQKEMIDAFESRQSEIAGMAGGGLIGGRGTGTSDSNLAWVSRGEHIMPARAVAQPGMLSFLEALRRSGGNLRGVLDGLSHFAVGGVMPAFAAGGPVGGMSNVTIQFPGLPPIAGLRASSPVVDELQRAAAMAQVRSGGRKPSRYS